MTRSFRGKRYWLVGASEGLGKALAKALSDEGAELVLSARSEAALTDLASALPGAPVIAPMDVGKPEDVDRAAALAGDLDGVVYLAGTYWPLSAAEWNTEQALTMMDVNYSGAVRVLGAVLPDMISKARGHVVLTGSFAGYRGLPGAIGYGSSKAALMTLGESMQTDLVGRGVDVQLANPGFIRTRLTDKNAFDMPFIMEPEEASAAMLKGMKSGKKSFVFPWRFSLVFRLARFLPDSLYLRFFGQKA